MAPPNPEISRPGGAALNSLQPKTGVIASSNQESSKQQKSDSKATANGYVKNQKKPTSTQGHHVPVQASSVPRNKPLHSKVVDTTKIVPLMSLNLSDLKITPPAVAAAATPASSAPTSHSHRHPHHHRKNLVTTSSNQHHPPGKHVAELTKQRLSAHQRHHQQQAYQQQQKQLQPVDVNNNAAAVLVPNAHYQLPQQQPLAIDTKSNEHQQFIQHPPPPLTAAPPPAIKVAANNVNPAAAAIPQNYSHRHQQPQYQQNNNQYQQQLQLQHPTRHSENIKTEFTTQQPPSIAVPSSGKAEVQPTPESEPCQCHKFLNPFHPYESSTRFFTSLPHYCRVCNIHLNSCRQSRIHSEGKKHIKRYNCVQECIEKNGAQITAMGMVDVPWSSMDPAAGIIGIPPPPILPQPTPPGHIVPMYATQPVQQQYVSTAVPPPPLTQVPQPQQQQHVVYHPTVDQSTTAENASTQVPLYQQQSATLVAYTPQQSVASSSTPSYTQQWSINDGTQQTQQQQIYQPQQTVYAYQQPPQAEPQYQYQQPAYATQQGAQPPQYQQPQQPIYQPQHPVYQQATTVAPQSPVQLFHYATTPSPYHSDTNTSGPGIASSYRRDYRDSSILSTSSSAMTIAPPARYHSMPPPVTNTTKARPSKSPQKYTSSQQPHRCQCSHLYRRNESSSYDEGTQTKSRSKNSPNPMLTPTTNGGSSKKPSVEAKLHESSMSSTSSEGILCEVCQVAVNSTQQMKAHLSGHKHKVRAVRRGLKPDQANISPSSSTISPSNSDSEKSFDGTKNKNDTSDSAESKKSKNIHHRQRSLTTSTPKNTENPNESDDSEENGATNSALRRHLSSGCLHKHKGLSWSRSTSSLMRKALTSSTNQRRDSSSTVTATNQIAEATTVAAASLFVKKSRSMNILICATGNSSEFTAVATAVVDEKDSTTSSEGSPSLSSSCSTDEGVEDGEVLSELSNNGDINVNNEDTKEVEVSIGSACSNADDEEEEDDSAVQNGSSSSSGGDCNSEIMPDAKDEEAEKKKADDKQQHEEKDGSGQKVRYSDFWVAAKSKWSRSSKKQSTPPRQTL